MSMHKGFRITVLAASTALAMGSTAAMAVTAPATGQLPGRGSIVSGHVSAGGISNGQQTITIGNAGDLSSANAIINWGSGTAINAGGIGGFNIGSDAGLNFADGTANGSGAAVLNIDSSGNPSQIYGKLNGTGTSIFVANNNGIIVGATGRISSTAQVGLIGNTLGSTGGFAGTLDSIVYGGSGGDVTVYKGASVNGNTVLISGGNNVNVSLNALTGPSGSTRLSAGVSASPYSPSNHGASLAVSGALPSGVALAGFRSAGSASNSGTLSLAQLVQGSAYHVYGLLTNTGTLTLPASNGAVHNQGKLITTVYSTFSSLTNDGTYSSHGVNVQGGDLINHGSLSGYEVRATDGSIVNTGTISGVYGVYTATDSHYVAGADYSITNSGTIASWGGLTIDANRSKRYDGSSNSSTGSLNDTGTLILQENGKLQMKGWNNVTLGGVVNTRSSDGVAQVSTAHPLGELILSSSGYNATIDTPTFWNDGAVTLETPVAVSGAILHGRQVKILSNLSSVNSSAVAAGNVTIAAGSQMANDYAVIVGNGATVSAQLVSIEAPKYKVQPTDGRIVRPNVLLQGTLSAANVYLGVAGQPVSDVYAGPQGGIVMTSTAPSLTIGFTGNVGLEPDLQDANFRLDYLPVRAARGPLRLVVNPLAFKAGAESINLLVDGSVNFVPPFYWNSPGIFGTGSASSPATIPNSRLVLQSTGNIVTQTGNFYWPGYVYLGNIGSNVDGTPAPGTLGAGTITLGGKLSNVLPGSTDSGVNIEFITQHPLAMNGYSVTTNANSYIDFGTDALTQQYASGSLGSGLFYGGTQSGSKVNYAALDPSMFRTDAPTANP